MTFRARAFFRMDFVAALVLLSSLQTRVGTPDVHIREIMAGANGDSRIQFIVIEQTVAGANLWGPQAGETQSRMMLVFYDALDRETGKFKFPDSPPTSRSLKTLIATQEFAGLSGAPAPDVVIPPFLHALSGKICFRNNPANAAAPAINDCVAYGQFSGDTEANRSSSAASVPAGPPAPLLPILNAVSLRRDASTGRNSDFSLSSRPEPVNTAGESFTIPVQTVADQGQALFNFETFSGNGRTCATCHVARDAFGLTPENVQSRFATLRDQIPSFDPLFIGESAPSSFDVGFDFNLNTLRLTGDVATPAPCTGELRGILTAANRGRAKVLARIGPATYLVYGGVAPALSGEVTDGVCTATVAGITAGDLAAPGTAPSSGIEDPRYMREPTGSRFPLGRGLILENIDGFAKAPVFRRSPHLLNLRQTAPYGLSGEFPDLQSFSTGAVQQHFPRTLARNSGGPNPDFRLPTPAELDAIAAFLLSLDYPAGDDPNKFDLARFATTARQRRGLEEFVVFDCAVCHGGAVLSQTTVSILGSGVGVNGSFNTGSASGAFGDSLPCEPPEDRLGACGSRKFSTPQLFNLPHLGPYFHNGAVNTLSEAVDFYISVEFGNSPVNVEFIHTGIGIIPSDAITEFLAGLVVRPYRLSEGPIRFGALAIGEGRTAERTITITNTGADVLEFDTASCRLEGRNPADFTVTQCPLTSPMAPRESRTLRVAFAPGSDGLRSATLEVHPAGTAPSGIDLFGTGGALGPGPRLQTIRESSGSTRGGDRVTLQGLNFASGATVTIGGVRADYLEVLNATTITARTPRHAAGRVDVEVVNPDGQTAALSNAYRFEASLD